MANGSQSWAKAGVIISAVVALTGIAGVWIAYQQMKDDGAPTPKLTATFERPSEGDAVPYPVPSPSGAVRGLGSRNLWLFSNKANESRIRPQQGRCIVKDGNWHCPDLYLGTGPTNNVGSTYELTLLAADADADRRFRELAARPKPERYGSFSPPISGTTRVDSIRVRRR